MKTEILDEIKQGVNEILDRRNSELQDRKKRELNVTIFNLPEHNSPIEIENKRTDKNNIRTISESLGLENIDIVTSYRLGKEQPGKCRPLKIILSNKVHKFMLDNSRFIPTKVSTE